MAHLYVMQRSDAPGVLKIGRSDDPTKRAGSLQSGHCFFVRVLAVFQDAGHHERLVHEQLNEFNVQTGAGQEWFRTNLASVYYAIGCVSGGMSTCPSIDETKVDAEMIARAFAEEFLVEWERSMGKPSSRKDIHVKFDSLPQHSGLTAARVLKTILFDQFDGKPCRVKGFWGCPETSVYRTANFKVVTLSDDIPQNSTI